MSLNEHYSEALNAVKLIRLLEGSQYLMNRVIFQVKKTVFT